MATNTTNYNLKKPSQIDFYNVDVFNDNADIIDTKLKEGVDGTATAKVEVKDWAVGAFSNPNLLINGDFQVWQRGTSFSGNTYTADRWSVTDYSQSQNLFAKISQSNDIPQGTSGKSVEIEIKNVGEAFVFSQSLEADLIPGNTYTMSSWVKGPEGAVVHMAFMDTAHPYTMTGGWQYITFTRQSTEGNTNRIAPIRMVSKTGKYYIKNVKLELGSVATPFVPRSYGEELALCQRYYFISSIPIYSAFSMIAVTQTMLNGSIVFPAPMRVTPTLKKIKLRSNLDGTVLVVTSHAKQADVYGINALFFLTFESGELTAGQWYTIELEADAEI